MSVLYFCFLICFRHFNSGSLALASLNHTYRNLVPTFPQRSPPWLLTTAACGGLRSAPDCRTQRALLHLSYSYAMPFGPALLVTQTRFFPCHIGLPQSPSGSAYPQNSAQRLQSGESFAAAVIR